MARPTKDSQDNVSLEELLRFKRAERPDEAFWNRFDSQLHQRMMQTLVKKDPWPVQLLRGLSGRLAQTTAIGAAAAVLAMMVVRPAFVATDEAVSAPAQFAASVEVSAEVEELAVEIEISELDPALLANADYAIEVYTADQVNTGADVTREFSLDSIQVASYDSAAYSADSALPAFASTGLASLVF